MKKNFIKYIAALAVAPMLLSSCSDDFLNEIDPNRQIVCGKLSCFRSLSDMILIAR